MKISHKWLQTYFKNPLPSSEEIAELLTFHIFEVEGIEKKSYDDVFDVKVLPDRASYCLSHEGVARELGAIISSNEFIPRNLSPFEPSPDVSALKANIETSGCNKHVELQILNLSVHSSPEWLVKYLEAIGQKSINLIVDLTNFVMLDIGQPMHVFDASKLSGDITIRNAKEGEKIELLGGKEVSLDNSIMVLADNDGALDIAGIKGGKKAEMTSSSDHLVIVASNFDPSQIRKTSTKIGIKTDASKRFENGLSPLYPEIAMKYFVELLKKEDPEALVGPVTVIGDGEFEQNKIELDPKFVVTKLGADITTEDIISCLNRGSIPARREGDKIAVFPPFYRKDLIIAEDLVDEVGRLWGYENINPVLPKINLDIVNNSEIHWKNVVRNFLIENGYSEIYTYSLVNKGEAEIANPLASDKGYFRSDLSTLMNEKLASNIYYADLLGHSKIKLFEFGRVFRDGREFTSLSIGVAYKKAKKGERVNDEIKAVRDELFGHLGVNVNILCTVDDTGGIISKNGKSIGVINNIEGVMEVDFESLIEGLAMPSKAEALHVSPNKEMYKPFSSFPFMVRDVAVFTGATVTKEDVFAVIECNAGEFMVRHELFDVFEKKNKETGEVEKISYAFRLVFQSYDKTLTDEEINRVMDNIYNALKEHGFEVR